MLQRGGCQHQSGAGAVGAAGGGGGRRRGRRGRLSTALLALTSETLTETGDLRPGKEAASRGLKQLSGSPRS